LDEPIVDPEWVTVKNVKITKYNRNTSVMKGVVRLLKDLPDNTIVSITYSLLFPRMILFIPFNCFLFHTRNFANKIDVRPLMSRHTFVRHSETNECEQTLFQTPLRHFSRALQPQFLLSATKFTWH